MRLAGTTAGLELVIVTPWTDVQDGESIAVDGACLTVARRAGSDLTFHIIRTSLERTNFSTYEVGRRVNIERALRVGDRLGGHLVQGHVDGVGTVRDDSRPRRRPPRRDRGSLGVSRISVPLGSVTVDGVSLTVNAVPASGCNPDLSHPVYFTAHDFRRPSPAGDRVHLEADTIGKYVEPLMRGREKENGTT